MTYQYELISDGPHKGQIVEVEQSIKASPLTTFIHDNVEYKVKRVIAGNTNFILKGDCWARTNYSRGAQDRVTAEDRSKFGKKP